MNSIKTMPFRKYRPYPGIRFSGRTWPDRVIRKAPQWCSVDLRDGNQALSTPMGMKEKEEMFKLLTGMGFKEIEVGFPSAAQVEFEFIRTLIEKKRIPKDVTIQVITQAREDLIRRTFESIGGARNVIVHLYNSTSSVQREIVFRKSRREIIRIAQEAARLMARLKKEYGNPGIRFQYSPESFHGTELDFALDICHAVMEEWQPSAKNKMIINLPQTVEMSTPNIYADRIEWFIRHVRNRDAVVMSVHTHNDRSTGVAAAEFAVMAGAERVEGALFGNGERTGNMDIVTMALNLFSQGVNPELDLGDIPKIREIYTRCTGMTVHPRHPYSGDLVFTAFSGSHQDAISKGFKARKGNPAAVWEVPYLPIDPKDIGRSYESIIRINSQSGKGGVAYVMEQSFGWIIPKEMRRDFSKSVQMESEKQGTELTAEEIRACFEREYLNQKRAAYRLHSCVIHTGNGEKKETQISVVVYHKDKAIPIRAAGNGPLDALINGIRERLGFSMDIAMYSEHALGKGAKAKAISYIGIRRNGRNAFGAGIDPNISTASVKAVISALNRF